MLSQMQTLLLMMHVIPVILHLSLSVADITSLHPSLSFPLVGRGTETDSGESLLWQLLSKWWQEGQPDVI